MDPLTLSIITGLAVNYFTAFTEDAVRDFFTKAFRLKPPLEKQLRNAATSQQLQQVLNDATGVIEANAAAGTIDVDGALLQAIKHIRFDHQHGTVTIGNSTVVSAIVVTGGSAGATGQTLIGGNTELRSAGTSIKIEQGATIKMTGSASIRQT